MRNIKFIIGLHRFERISNISGRVSCTYLRLMLMHNETARWQHMTFHSLPLAIDKIFIGHHDPVWVQSVFITYFWLEKGG